LIQELRRVAELQLEYSSENTEAMQERGDIIRHQLPDLFRYHLPRFAAKMGPTGDDLSIDASDGIGRKTQAPWVRFFSKQRSPRPTSGFYVVVHFSIDGQRIYVTLGCSSSIWDAEAGDLVQVPNDELDRRVMWVLQTLEDAGESVADFPDIISLGSTLKLPISFERATALAKQFSPKELTEEDFIASLERAHQLLGVVYEAFDAGKNLTEGQINQNDVEILANPHRLTEAGRQGFRLSAADRKAIEMRAMDVTRDYLIENGYEITDTYKNNPFDILAKRGDEALKVEVKGSTAKFVDAVMMTRNEVRLHKDEAGSTALAIVSDIALSSDDAGQATGGRLEFLNSWSIEEWELEPLMYQVKRRQ